MEVETIVNETLYQILKKHGISKEMITPEKSVVDDLKAESLDIIEMMLALEEKFDVSIDEEELPQLQSVGSIYTYVNNYLQVKNSSYEH
jgi:acyl carrier protein